MYETVLNNNDIDAYQYLASNIFINTIRPILASKDLEIFRIYINLVDENDLQTVLRDLIDVQDLEKMEILLQERPIDVRPFFRDAIERRDALQYYGRGDPQEWQGRKNRSEQIVRVLEYMMANSD